MLEEGIINVGVDSFKGDLGGGGDDVGRVDSAERHSVDGIGSSDQQVAGGEGLQDDHSAASADSGEQDDD